MSAARAFFVAALAMMAIGWTATAASEKDWRIGLVDYFGATLIAWLAILLAAP